MKSRFFSFLGRQVGKKWLCTTWTSQLCVFLVIRFRDVLFFQKNRRPFAWMFITYHDVIDVFGTTTIIFFEYFLRPIDTSIFLSDWQIVRIQSDQIFQTVKCLCVIEFMLVSLIPKVFSIWRCVTWRSRNINSYTASMVFGTTTSSHEIELSSFMLSYQRFKN